MIFGLSGDPSHIIEVIKRFFSAAHNIAFVLGGILVGFSFRILPKLYSIIGYHPSEYINNIIEISSFALGALLFIWGGWGGYKDKAKLKEENLRLVSEANKLEDSQREVENLKSNIEGLNQNLANSWLIKLYKDLELGSYERITIYYHFNQHFYLLARYSSNPVNKEVHRQKFPLNNGVISQVWQNDEHQEVKCPKHEVSAPNPYINYMQSTYNYDSNKLDSLNMKSHRFYGKGINFQDTRIGAILIESTNCDAIDQKLCEDVNEFCSRYGEHLVEVVQNGIKYDREIETSRKPSSSRNVEESMKEKLGG